jgi:integrase
MAWLQSREGSWRVIFRHRRQQYSYPVGPVDEAEAHAVKGRVEYLLMRLRQNLLTLPPGCDIVRWLRHDGKPPDTTPARRDTTLAELRDDYLRAHESSLVGKSLKTIRRHFRNLAGVLGEKLPVATLSLSRLQDYVKSREGSVQAATIRAEIVSLRTAWHWGALYYQEPWGKFPSRGLRYPRAKEKPPFMLRAEIERRISQGGDAAALWECLYLTPGETAELLEHVKATAIQPWVFPMVVMAAHTGARRSELIRARVEDVDFAAGVVTIRERKRRRGMDSTRRVPISPPLRQALAEYTAARPDCPMLFCQGKVVRSKKTGRIAEGVTLDEAQHHLGVTLRGSKWEVVRGWHVLRHSFVSALASRGVDQRIIDDFTGHTTDEMRRRYRHLYPDVKQQAISGVFG